MNKRDFLKSLSATVMLASLPSSKLLAETRENKSLPVRTKISLNAYSFNQPLMSGEMSMDDMLEYAAEVGFEGVDLTGYYFPGYPTVPTDDYIYHIKQKAFSLGVEICGTGVRNNFVQADSAARAEAVQHVKEWIQVASKLGGQTIRIFAGKEVPEGYTRKEAFQWVVDCIKECAEYGEQNGIILAIQNHNEFLKTAEEVEILLDAVHSKWVGLMLDIGSYRSSIDPFREIEQTVKYAITWQIKEEMAINGKVVKTDLDRLKQIIDASGYRGYLPIETLGPGNPKEKVTYMLKEVKKRFSS